jgi:hypothetical protein
LNVITSRHQRKSHAKKKNPLLKFDNSDFILTDDELNHRCLLKNVAKHSTLALEVAIGQDAKLEETDECYCKFEEMDQNR